MDCDLYQHHLYKSNTWPYHWWELATDPQGNIVWQQQIRGQQWASSTEAVQTQLSNLGLCTLPTTPVETQPQPTAATTPTPSPTAIGGATDGGGIGLLLVLGLGASAVWAWFNKGKDDHADDYHPMIDVPLLPPVYTEVPVPAQGNSTSGIQGNSTLEFARTFREFEPNSTLGPGEFDSNSPPEDWPPKTMGAPFDPMQPEQPGEFEAYRRAVEQDGLSPKGNDILKQMWGIVPGKSQAYSCARSRRDEFAKRLHYYRYEEM